MSELLKESNITQTKKLNLSDGAVLVGRILFTIPALLLVYGCIVLSPPIERYFFVIPLSVIILLIAFIGPRMLHFVVGIVVGGIVLGLLCLYLFSLIVMPSVCYLLCK